MRKRDPYITKLGKDELGKYPVRTSFSSGDDLRLQLAVVSMIVNCGNRGYWLVCRSLSRRGRTVFLPRWGYRCSGISRCGEYVEVEEDHWMDPYDPGPESIWVEVGDQIIYFEGDRIFFEKFSWTFAKALEQCFVKLESTPHYRVMVGGEEVYQGLSVHDARLTVPYTVEPTELGRQFAKALNIPPVPLGVEVFYRHGPRGDWQEMTSEQLLSAGFRSSLATV